LWKTVDNSENQLVVRRWWYESDHNQQAAERISAAINAVGESQAAPNQ
jgi:hypothetical protein